MSWPPNAAAARFLATHVLPRVQATSPDAALTIVGRDPGSEVRALSGIRNVTITGSVPDIIPYVREASVLAVPLDAGGGTRLKILEAFAAGLPVVSTPIGCEGIDCRHDQELLVAERPAFADTIALLLADPPRGEPLALRARALARAKYDWPVVSRAATTVVTSLVSRVRAAEVPRPGRPPQAPPQPPRS
jgi:glycosyltransferase involved in cell wall biosynthesis